MAFKKDKMLSVVKETSIQVKFYVIAVLVFALVFVVLKADTNNLTKDCMQLISETIDRRILDLKENFTNSHVNEQRRQHIPRDTGLQI